MSRVNRALAVVAAVLLVLSFATWRRETGRAERFERGQKLLPQLNPDEIAAIELSAADRKVTMKRTGGRFTIAELQGYPARNEAVNRLIRDLMEIELEQEVGVGEDLEAELELAPPGESTVEVALRNAAEREMVRLRLGKSLEAGPPGAGRSPGGRYVQRIEGEEATIYRTSGSLYVQADTESFVDKEIVDVERDEIRAIRGEGFELAADDAGELRLAEIPAGREQDTSRSGRLRSLLGPLRYEKAHVADDPEVRGLSFRQAVRVDLADGSGYLLTHAERDGRHFMEVAGFHTVEEIAIAQDTPEEELEEKAEILTRADEIADFNAFHGSWVYEISDYVAETLATRKQDLLREPS